MQDRLKDPTSDEIERLLRESWAESDEIAPLDIRAELRQVDDERVHTNLAPVERQWQDDWSDTQVPYVRMLMERCRKVVLTKTPEKVRRSLIDWCFGKKLSSGHLRVSFNDCCFELDARPYVMQAMIQHQWFRRGILIEHPLPHHADPVHEGILTEATLHSFDTGADIAVAVWTHPSRPLAHVIQQVAAMGHSADDADIGIASLVEAGLLDIRNGRVWFTGRSRKFLASRRTSFARSFIEPQDSPYTDPRDRLTPDEANLFFGTDDDDS